MHVAAAHANQALELQVVVDAGAHRETGPHRCCGPGSLELHWLLQSLAAKTVHSHRERMDPETHLVAAGPAGPGDRDFGRLVALVRSRGRSMGLRSLQSSTAIYRLSRANLKRR